jgi:hypothetical protein
MLRSLREKLKWASLKNGVIKIGLGLTQAVKSLANAVRLRIKKILTAVFLRPKRDPSPKNERRATAAKKKREGAKGKTVVKNTKAAEVQNAKYGGEITRQKAKRKTPRPKNGKVVARGCGKVLSNRRKYTAGSVST